MDPSNAALRQTLYALALVTAFFALLSTYFAVRLRRLNHLYKKMMRGTTGESIEQMMLSRIRDIEELKQTTSDLQTELNRIDLESRAHLQRVGVVRFNAFDNTGSDLSFAMALLDADDTGVVLSSIYGREDSRIYAKPFIKGESNYLLTHEEKKAVEIARKK